MENLVPEIRNAVRALIVQNHHILLLRKAGGDRGERFALPGGAQDPGETLEQALQRECLEEIGTRVAVHDLLHVADFFKSRETDPPSTRHLVEFLFRCNVPATYTPRNGHRPDKHQLEVVWTRLDQLQGLTLYAPSLASRLESLQGAGESVYLGTID
jgi:ADP-ribose pyrophosphatase YjhB (NUDIX family)